ncbi:MAG TPA: hypothetical protein VGX71_13810 [Pseudaminobacter sp.]|nr:hypothetical protein [Pseudaminobacter sp.]
MCFFGLARASHQKSPAIKPVISARLTSAPSTAALATSAARTKAVSDFNVAHIFPSSSQHRMLGVFPSSSQHRMLGVAFAEIVSALR